MKKQPTRTTFTLFAEFVEELGGERMKQAFLRDRHMFEKRNMFVTPLTEEQYQLGLKVLRAKIPALRYLLQSRLIPYDTEECINMCETN